MEDKSLKAGCIIIQCRV